MAVNKVKQAYKAELICKNIPQVELVLSCPFFDSQEWRTSLAGAVMEE